MSNYTDDIFNNLIRRGRENKNCTQTNFASYTGYSNSTISRIENNERAITLPEFFKLIEALDCKAELTVAFPVFSEYSGRIVDYNYTTIGTLPSKVSNFAEIENHVGNLSDSDRKIIAKYLTILLRSIDTH